jgi:glycosyltransferase involved in cell wall biosynthesis
MARSWPFLPAGALDAVPRSVRERALVLAGRRFPRPKVRLAGGGAGAAEAGRPPTVFFLLSDYDKPSGGVQVIYRQVDILNRAGIRASVLHQAPGFRCSWFPNDTAVTDARATALRPRDVLVVTELDIDVVAGLPRPVSHLVLNQSGHLTWSQHADVVSRHYRERPDRTGLLGMLVVSEHSRALMSYALPGLPIHRVRPSVDPALFHPGSGARPRRLTYLPRRGRADLDLVLTLLRSRDALGGWEVTPVGGTGQAAFAEAMRSSRIVLSTSYQEGFGLPAAEAMACGNYVVGYHGYGGREFLRPEFSAPVATGDVLAAARAVEDAIRRDSESDWTVERGLQAAAFVAAEYGPDRERDDVVTAYEQLLNPLGQDFARITQGAP